MRNSTSKSHCSCALTRALRSFPLDGGDGLRREVVEDAVHALDLGEDAVGDLVQQSIGDLFDGGRGGVDRVHRAQNHGPVKGALAVLDAGALEIGNDGEVLPDLALKAVVRELFAEDRVGFSQRLETVAGDRAEAADAESRARERLAIYHVVGQAERLADDSYLVLIEELHGLDELEPEVFG